MTENEQPQPPDGTPPPPSEAPRVTADDDGEATTIRLYRLFVDVPEVAGAAIHQAMFDAVADAAHEAQPEDREGWDVLVYSHGMVTEDLPPLWELTDGARQAPTFDVEQAAREHHDRIMGRDRPIEERRDRIRELGRDDDYTPEALDRTAEQDDD